MNNLKKISRADLKKLSGGWLTHVPGYGIVNNLDCDNVMQSIALCPQQQAVKCIQLEAGNAIGCDMGQNCVNGACTGGLVFVK